MTNFLWEKKLEQEARMVYQDLILFMEATVTAGPGDGPSDGPLARRGLVIFENATYAQGKRIRCYTMIDPLGLLTATSMGSRNIASDGFCIIPTDASNQPLTDDTVEVLVTADGKISSPSYPLNLQIKAFDSSPTSGETDDTDAWNILIDPTENRIRLRH
ncbi:MAG: hypothetical protein WA705_16000 [Candidatus Ozemobacteraceae bacterium]